MFKIIKILSLALFASIVTPNVSAKEAEQKSIYAVAFPINENLAIPGFLSFTKEGDKTFLTLVKGELKVCMSVKISSIDDPFAKGKIQHFDAIYVSDDGLLTVIVTGIIGDSFNNSNEESGKGKIAIHHAASVKNNRSADIAIFPFTMGPLLSDFVVEQVIPNEKSE